MGSYACAWVPTTNSQRMRKLVVVLGLRMRMRLAVRLFSDHLIGALLCPLQHSPTPSPPFPSLLFTIDINAVLCLARPFQRSQLPSSFPTSLLYLGISLPCSACLAAAVRQLCLTLLYCLLLLLLVSLLLLLLLLHFVGFCGLAKKAKKKPTTTIKATQAGKIDTQGSLWFHNEICYAFNKSGGEGRRGRG